MVGSELVRKDKHNNNNNEQWLAVSIAKLDQTEMYSSCLLYIRTRLMIRKSLMSMMALAVMLLIVMGEI